MEENKVEEQANRIDNFEKYQSLMADMIVPVLTPYAEDIKEGKKIDYEQNKHEFFLFEGFTEISNIIDTLKLINIFINKEPPNDAEINYSNYLTYHVHNYFQEMYILKERLTTYGTKIQRKYKKVTDSILIENVKNMILDTTNSLKSITGDGGIRNLHVHEKKYTDDDFNWLSSTTLLVNSNHIDYTPIQEDAYKKTRDKWSKIIEENNTNLMIILDRYFGALLPVISKDNIVIKPHL